MIILTGTYAQCCRTWAVVQGYAVRDCGCCGRRPILLPALGTFTVRSGA